MHRNKSCLNFGDGNHISTEFDSLNKGSYNLGIGNVGDENQGDYNTGDKNEGFLNAGNHNYGDCNTGNCNYGSDNIGNYNYGEYNHGDCNYGAFNTLKRNRIFMFNKPSVWTIEQWLDSPARRTIRGVVALYPSCKYRQSAWDSLSVEKKKEIRSLPNFDQKIFEEIIGIKLDEQVEDAQARADRRNFVETSLKQFLFSMNIYVKEVSYYFSGEDESEWINVTFTNGSEAQGRITGLKPLEITNTIIESICKQR